MNSEYRPIVDKVANIHIERMLEQLFDEALPVRTEQEFSDTLAAGMYRLRRGIERVEKIRLMLHKDNEQ